MTISEKVQKVGYKIVTSSVGDSIVTLCFRAYGEHSDMGLTVLTYLNHRLDWDNLEVGTEIRYIPLEHLTDIELI